MLLWLTLAVLWSTPCWADQIYGNARGTYFSSTPDNTNDISGIRVSISLIGIIRSVQLRYGSNWSGMYGVPGGRATEFLLGPDEYIVGLVGSHRIYIRYLVVYTNLGRWAPFGMESGYTFTASPSDRGKILTGIFGQTQALGITGIGFKWDYPLVDQPPTPSNKTG
ncbi:zymogen granule protein 16 homolog B [Pipistrellus kuhlii]|uniref:zymogen granule protein 16 homolog B n=1 Tax=Pipistrellus kuhlii TaxID=59472 RepID=UPI001E272648|nr:zymogen granule protein 16 homolog B [Pipistrellus kuhlii]